MNSSITFIYDYKRGYPAIDIITTLVHSVCVTIETLFRKTLFLRLIVFVYYFFCVTICIFTEFRIETLCDESRIYMDDFTPVMNCCNRHYKSARHYTKRTFLDHKKKPDSSGILSLLNIRPRLSHRDTNSRLGMLFQEFIFLIQIIEISLKLIVGLVCCRHQ